MGGIGLDIVKISRMTEILDRSGDIFLRRAFTDTERQIGKAHHYPDAYYAATFAAKEAVFKLFGLGWDSGADLQEIEVLRGRQGEPLVELSGRLAQLAAKQPCPKVAISISYEEDTAIAVAALVAK